MNWIKKAKIIPHDEIKKIVNSNKSEEFKIARLNELKKESLEKIADIIDNGGKIQFNIDVFKLCKSSMLRQFKDIASRHKINLECDQIHSGLIKETYKIKFTGSFESIKKAYSQLMLIGKIS